MEAIVFAVEVVLNVLGAIAGVITIVLGVRELRRGRGDDSEEDKDEEDSGK